MELLYLLFGGLLGFIIGFLLGKLRVFQLADLSQQSGLVSSLTTQIAEMKSRFIEIEKSRELLEKEREKTEQEKEKRMKEWMEHTHRLFSEQSAKSAKVDEEKEKRMKEWMEHTRKFFEEQKLTTEKFLREQGRTREEIEQKRDAQIKDMQAMISSFTRAVSGTKQRGIAGEDYLKEVLSNSIRAGVVKTALRTGRGEVEFAWNLEDGKYIPIDSKMPDVFELLEKYNASTEREEQRGLKKEIIGKVKSEIRRVEKYQNQDNTLDACILVVPEGILEIAPEIVGEGRDHNVYVCSYRDVFPIAHMLHEQYVRLREEGDIGKYKQMLKSLFQILDKIVSRTDTIERAVVSIGNANESIREEIKKARKA